MATNSTSTQDLKDAVITTINTLVSQGDQVVVPDKETPVGRDSSPSQNLVNVTTSGYALSKVCNGWVGVGILVETPDPAGGWDESGVLIQGYSVSVVNGVVTASPIGQAHGGIAPVYPNYSVVAPLGANDLQAGDPINTSDGDVCNDATDFSLPNLGTPLEMTRHYHSVNTSASGAPTATPDRGMGDGWSFTYSDSLTVNADQSVTWFTDTGISLKFTKQGSSLHHPQHDLRHPRLPGGRKWLSLDGQDRRQDAMGRQRPVGKDPGPL